MEQSVKQEDLYEKCIYTEDFVDDEVVKRNSFRRLWYNFKKRKIAVIGLCIVFVFILVAIFANQLAPFDPYEQNLGNSLLSPSAAAKLGLKNLLGTDESGRDLLSRLMYGARISMWIGLFTAAIGFLIGAPLGVVAGFFGKKLEMFIMRAMDVMMAFPQILLAILLTSIFGQDLKNAIIAVGICTIPNFARTSRSETLSIRSSEYVEAARALGAKNGRIIFSHVMINVISPLIVLTTLNFGNAIITTAGMGFLGVGAQPPTPEWGAMLSNGRQFLLIAPHICTITGVVIMILVLGLNLFGDGLRDVLDPKLKD